MMKSSVEISICICTYNQGAYIEKAIRSALEQTVNPIEIIVSNDCSTDDTAEILHRLELEIQILKVINHPRNLGISKNVDACLRMATGEFVVRLDSDDLLRPTYLERVSAELIKYPSAGYGHAGVLEIDEHGRSMKERALFRGTGFQSDVDALRATLKGYRVAANILMFRKEALKEVDYMLGRPDFGEDYHLAASISRAGYGNIYVAETLAHYRIWTDGGKLRQRRKLAEIKGLQQVFSDVIEPAFRERVWSFRAVRKSKRRLACAHADCLAWDKYTDAEKKELSKEIRKLSKSRRAQFYSWIYLNGRGSLFFKIDEVRSTLRSILKAYLMKRRQIRTDVSRE